MRRMTTCTRPTNLEGTRRRSDDSLATPGVLMRPSRVMVRTQEDFYIFIDRPCGVKSRVHRPGGPRN